MWFDHCFPFVSNLYIAITVPYIKVGARKSPRFVSYAMGVEMRSHKKYILDDDETLICKGS